MKKFQVKWGVYIIPLILISTCLFFSYLKLSHGINFLDEGSHLYISEQVLKGRILYKDLFAIYGPGTYYLTALFFKLFGTSQLIGRLPGLISHLFLIITIFYLAKKLMTPIFAIFPSLLSIVLGHSNQAVILALLGILCLFVFYENHDFKYLILSGICNGLAFAFKQEIGMYLLPVGLAVSFLSSGKKLLFQKTTSNFNNAFKRIALYLIGVSLVVIPIIVYFLINGALKDMFFQLFILPARIIKFNTLPFPKLLPLLPKEKTFEAIYLSFYHKYYFYIPVIIYVISIILLGTKIKNRQFKLTEKRVATLLAFGIFLFNSVLWRSDGTHLLYSISPAYILGFYLAYLFFLKTKKFLNEILGSRRTINIVSSLILLSILLFPSLILLDQFRIAYKENYNNSLEKLNLSKSQIRLKTDTKNEVEGVISFLQDNTLNKERIFVFPYAPMIYFLADRNTTIKYDLILEGYVTANDERAIIKSLKENHIRYTVVWWQKVDKKPIETHAPLVTQYVFENYEEVERFGNFSILSKNTLK